VERKYSSWLGGSILASLGTFNQLWIGRVRKRDALSLSLLVRLMLMIAAFLRTNISNKVVPSSIRGHDDDETLGRENLLVMTFFLCVLPLKLLYFFSLRDNVVNGKRSVGRLLDGFRQLATAGI
jgi:hypothetical protein